MVVKFKGQVCGMTSAMQIATKSGKVVTKSTLFVAPTKFDPNTGEPTAGEFADAFPVECLDERINEAAQFQPGASVMVSAALAGRSSLAPDGTAKGFLTLRLMSITADGVQPMPQQYQPQAAPQQCQQGGALPFNPL